MVKVLIVDDEAVVRIGLKSMIDWKTNGFDLVGEAPNGEKALELSESQQPDIVLTDIKMPAMDGLELISYPFAPELRPQFIVLSSYDDFQFVKGALKAGAKDYLLKLEMTPDKLLEVLRATSQSLETSREAHARLAVKSPHRTVRNSFFNLISGVALAPADHEAFLSLFSEQAGQRRFGCLVLRSLDLHKFDTISETDLHMLNSSVVNVVEEILNEYGTAFCIAGYRGTYYGVFAIPQERDGAGERARGEEFCTRIPILLGQYLNLNVKACIGWGGEGLEGIRNAYQEAMGSLENGEAKGDFSWGVAKALEYINHHYQEDISLDDVADYVGLSESYLSRLLKQATGKSYSRILIHSRIERAKYLLSNTEEKVYAVSELVGYKNPFYFDRLFKSTVGISPSDYRNRRKR